MPYLALALVAGFAAVERKGFLQAMLSRPIAVGPIAGLALGDAGVGLYVAAALELLWLGAVNLGAALPVHEALGTVAIAGGTILATRALAEAGLSGPAVLPAAAAAAVAVCAPLALVGRRVDRLIEASNERLHARAEADLARGDAEAAVRVNLRGLALPFGLGFVLAPLGAAVAAAVIPALLARLPGAVPLLAGGWLAFVGVAAASGAKAMRAARAPAFYYVALAVGTALTAAATLARGLP